MFSEPRTFTFTPANFQDAYCFSVAIQEDMVLEDTEIFHLSLTSDDPSVDFKNSNFTIEILDNEGTMVV